MNINYDSISKEVRKSISKEYKKTFFLLRLPRESQSMEDFCFTTDQLHNITSKLNAIAQKFSPNAKIYVSDVEACKTIKNCIDLVIESTGII